MPASVFRDALVVGQAWLLFPLVDAQVRIDALRKRLLRVFPPAPVPEEALARQTGRGGSFQAQTERIAVGRRVARLVRMAARLHFLINTSCLRTSIVTAVLLRESHIAADVRIGAIRHQGTLRRHAWLEIGGVPITDPGRGRPRWAVFGRPLGGGEAGLVDTSAH